MTMNGAASPGRYVFGVVRAMDGARLSKKMKRFNIHLGLVDCDSIAAAVKPASLDPVEPSRRNLLEHSETLEWLAENCTVLPMRFGVVAPGEEALRRGYLDPLHDELLGLLDEMEGRTELQVKAYLAEEWAVKEIVAADPAVRRIRERVKRRGGEGSYQDQVAMGEMVAGHVDSLRRRTSADILRSLAPLAVRWAEGPITSEWMAANLSFLVDRHDVAAFDGAVKRIGDETAGHMEIRYAGPLPVYTFVDLPIRPAGEPARR
jgi:hypothetical protein